MFEMLLKYIYVVSLSFWIGGISLFSFVQAPSLFRKLKRSEAGQCVEVMFPGYYLMSYICAGLGLMSLLYIYGLELSKVVILLLMLLLSMAGGLYVMPKIRQVKLRIKEGEGSGIRKEFKALHKLSLYLNFGVWILGMVMLYMLSMELNKS